MERYWLYNWLDRHGISRPEHTTLLLRNQVAVDDLRDLATKASLEPDKPTASDNSIVAGRGIDLSGELDCYHVNCMKAQVDRLFGRVWHYFDTIIVDDSLSHRVAVHWEQWESDEREEMIQAHVGMMLYLREIQAEHLVRVVKKPRPCTAHLKHHSKDAGLTAAFEGTRQLALQIAKTAEVKLHLARDGSVSYSLNHPTFVHTRWGELSREEARGESEEKNRLAALQKEIRIFLSHLNSDVAAAHSLGLPLGASIPLHQTLLQRCEPPGLADVAFQLQLPVLEGLPARAVVSLRNEEREHFVRFRSQLRRAIDERLKTNRSNDAKTVADEIRNDLIEPELDKIRDRLRASQKTMAKKTTVGIFLGALATTCGLLAGASATVAVSGGVTAVVGAALAAGTKHLDEAGELSLNSMYFVWKASQRTHTQ